MYIQKSKKYDFNKQLIKNKKTVFFSEYLL